MPAVAPAGVEALGPGALLEEHLDARRRAASDPLRHGEARRVEAEQLAGDDARGEVRSDGRGVEAGVVEAAVGGEADADRGLHAGDVGEEDVGA